MGRCRGSDHAWSIRGRDDVSERITVRDRRADGRQQVLHGDGRRCVRRCRGGVSRSRNAREVGPRRGGSVGGVDRRGLWLHVGLRRGRRDPRWRARCEGGRSGNRIVDRYGRRHVAQGRAVLADGCPDDGAAADGVHRARPPRGARAWSGGRSRDLAVDVSAGASPTWTRACAKLPELRASCLW